MAWRGISMNRRGFIQSFIGAAAMVATGKAVTDDGVALKSIAHPGSLSGEVGFGLAQAKMEGASIPYDQGLMAEYPKILKEGLTKMFGDVYSELDPDNLEELWIDDQDQG